MQSNSAVADSCFECACYFYSKELKRYISSVADAAVAFLFSDGRIISVGTEPVTQVSTLTSALTLPAQSRTAADELRLVETINASDELAGRLDRLCPTTQKSGPWLQFHFGSASGTDDTVAVRLRAGSSVGECRKLLATGWRRLRTQCLAEAQREFGGVGNDALLWLITNKIDLGVMVLNRDGMLLKANGAAMDLIAQGKILRPGRGGIEASSPFLTRKFRQAIEECVSDESAACERVVLLEYPDEPRPVPVTLSKYPRPERNADLVVAFVPVNPDADRICKLATELGLTQVEARVASLLQLGLSNREAAARAGVTEQTFATYSKRVLNKLHASSRAEVAQLLTWQAVGGRV